MRTQWVIKGIYNGKTEVLDCFESFSEAVKMRREYELAYGSSWTISVHKKVS